MLLTLLLKSRRFLTVLKMVGRCPRRESAKDTAGAVARMVPQGKKQHLVRTAVLMSILDFVLDGAKGEQTNNWAANGGINVNFSTPYFAKRLVMTANVPTPTVLYCMLEGSLAQFGR